jgi:hypothetical protein
MRFLVSIIAASIGASSLVGCAGDYVARTRGVRQAYESGTPAAAIQQLDAVAPKEGEDSIDKLLFLLDKGMILHAAGEWEKSIAVLGAADELSKQLDFTSLSEEAGTLLSSERQRVYRGEDFEKLMISVLQALNYAQLGKDEDALVEIRRCNERLLKMISDEKKPYEQLAIARYLGGVLYEDQNELDSAFIDYAEADKLGGGLGHLAEPLLRLAKKTEREDAYLSLLKRYPDVPHPPLGKDEGQVVVVVEAGRSPVKESSRRSEGAELFVVPVYRDRLGTPRTVIEVDNRPREAVTVTSLDAVAKVHLDDRIGKLVAKAVASTVVKAGVAAGAAALTKSEEVGALTFLLLTLLNEADTRSWLSLPAEFQLARMRLPAGKHEITVRAGGQSSRHSVEIRSRRISLLVVRSY